jgi:hypothetical protein
MPDDIRNMLNSGKSVDQVAEYMVNSQRAFSNDAAANLAFTILTDPLNFTPFVFGKVHALAGLANLGKFGATGAAALAGGAAAGPIGAGVGAYTAWQAAKNIAKGGELAAETARNFGNVEKAAVAAGDTSKILNPAEAILQKLGGKIEESTGVATKLEQSRAGEGVGLDLTKRIASAAKNDPLIAQAEKRIAEIDKLSDADKTASIISERSNLTRSIMDAKNEMEISHAIHSDFLKGMYNGVVGGKNAVAGGVRGFGAAITVPSAMAVPRALGGKVFNKTVDIITSAMPADVQAAIRESVGTGASNIPIIAATRMLVAPEIETAKTVAQNTANAYYQARTALGTAMTSGKDIVADTDNLVSTMVEQARQDGGVYARLGVSDTPDGLSELKTRVRIMHQGQVGPAAPAGMVANPGIAAMQTHIENVLSTGKLQQLERQEGGVAAAVAKKVNSLGYNELASISSDEVAKAINRLTPRMVSRGSVYQEFMSRMESIHWAHGQEWNSLAELKAKNAFESLFGEHFNGTALANEGSARDIAQKMATVDLPAYASANKVAAKINSTITPFLNSTPDPRWVESMILKHGQDGYKTLRTAARRIGINGVQLVRKGHMMQGSVEALDQVFKHMDELSQAGLELHQPTAEARMLSGEDLIREYIGGPADAAIVRDRLVSESIPEARRIGDEDKVRVLTDFAKQIEARNPKNMQELRSLWSELALKHVEDLTAKFGTVQDPNKIARFLSKVLEEGFATRPLSGFEEKLVRTLMHATGIDHSAIDAFKGSTYSLVRGSRRGYQTVSRLVENPNIDEATKRFVWESNVSPYIDMTSPYLDSARVVTPSYQANALQELMTGVFAPIGQNAVTNNIKLRMASYLSRGGVSKGTIDSIMDELVSRAQIEGVSARGVSGEGMKSAFENALTKAEGPSGYKDFVDRFNSQLVDASMQPFSPTNSVMYAFRGDFKVVGATQYLTGGAKQFAPFIAGITDNMYPRWRFKNNPLYWVQEYIESPTLNFARGVDRNVVQALSKEGELLSIDASAVRDLSRVAPETQSLVDNVNFLSIFRDKAIERAMEGNWNPTVTGSLWQRVKGATKSQLAGNKLEQLKQIKQDARDALAADIAAKNFAGQIREYDPELYNALVSHYGTTDSRTLFARHISWQQRMRDPERVLSDIDASRPAAFGFTTIPDRNGTVFHEAKTMAFGGMTPEGRLTLDDVRNGMLANPNRALNDLEDIRQSIADAGYDASMIDPQVDQLRAALYQVSDFHAKALGSGFGIDRIPSDLVSKFNEAHANLGKSFDKIAQLKKEANYRYLAASYMLQQGGFARSSYEASRLAEALALGHAYGPEVSNVAVNLQKIVNDVTKEVHATAAGELGVASLEGSNTEREVVSAIRQKAREYIDNNPEAIKGLDEATSYLITHHGAQETVHRAFKHVYSQALEQANKTTYFNPNRSFFERSINHPFLGFYPYSYMFKKILPEMTNFLFKSPFGVAAPGAGFEAYRHVRDYFEHQIETDYSFKKYLQDNNQVAFMAAQLFPGVPWDISAMPPSWVRTIAKSMSGNRKSYQLLTDLVGKDVLGSVAKIGPYGAAENMLGAGQQILNQLGGANNPKPVSYVGNQQLPPGFGQ